MTRLKDVLEYVVIHEIPHFIERADGKWFIELMGKHHFAWNKATAELNELPSANAVCVE